MRAWSLSPERVLAELDSDAHGISSEEAQRRLERWGPNRLEEEAGPGALSVLARQFRSPLIYLLMVAGLVTVAVGEFVDAAVIGFVLVFNATVGFFQEYRAARSLEALRRLAQARARVLRDRREREVDAELLVPGDVVLIEPGGRVPADARVLHSTALEVDESLLTGESTTVAKRSREVEPDAGLADRESMLFQGTTATRGHARAVVVATGGSTELGKIAGSVQALPEVRTPLQERISAIARLIGIAVPTVAALGFALGTAAGEDTEELFLAMVALAVAAIPEGLPIVLTIVLAISVSRMASRRALVRRLPAVETLGSCSVIGSDKTGTLTQNRMTVERIFAGGRRYAVTGTGYAAGGEILEQGRPVVIDESDPLRLALTGAVLCNEATAVEAGDELDVAGDPTEIALLVAATKAGLFKDELEEDLPRTAEIPFDAERRFAATFHDDADRELVFVKGAPERVLGMCDDALGSPRLEPDRVMAEAEAMAESGLRVLAGAYREREQAGKRPEPEAEVGGLTFLGLYGMMDPPREEAKEAVRGCQEAGIRAVMITGDHAVTAVAIARELGIVGPAEQRSDGQAPAPGSTDPPDPEPVDPALSADPPDPEPVDPAQSALTGRELDALDDEALEEVVGEVAVFARVAPEHKLRIVQALKRRGEVVAVTGDGVNDAPALKAADIGVAMGRSGTDAAREAAEMVVTDDNFASIFAAVEQGRVAFDNVRKTTSYLIAGSLAAVLAVLVSLLFRFDLPFRPAQLLWLNLVCYGIQDVALAFEPGEAGVLRRPPRRREEGIISRVLWERIAIVGALMAAGTLTIFLLELDRGTSLEQARTIAVTQLVVFMGLHVGNSRSEYLSVLQKSPFSNRFLFVGTALALSVHIAALHLPVTQFALGFEPIDLSAWAVIVATALSVIVTVEIHKRVRRPPQGAQEQRAPARAS
jgi:magnesium-transporting ATPase (P-type)